jgi:hypothetical protein
MSAATRRHVRALRIRCGTSKKSSTVCVATRSMLSPQTLTFNLASRGPQGSAIEPRSHWRDSRRSLMRDKTQRLSRICTTY